MSKHEHSKPYGEETLRLTEWELANTHLPPVTTVTLYEGSAPVEFIRSRIVKMLEKNPWITSRIVKKNTADWNSAIIFRPRAGKVGMLMITRRFDSDMLAQQKAQDGPDAPLGARIV